MTGEEILLVKKTWKILRKTDPIEVGIMFYNKLFEEAPQLKYLFTISIEEQSKKFVDMISLIIGRLDRIEELTEDIKRLALRHVDLGVKSYHYTPVGNALIWTLQQGLGKDWNAKAEAAWNSCYYTLSAAMIDASRQSEKIE